MNFIIKYCSILISNIINLNYLLNNCESDEFDK